MDKYTFKDSEKKWQEYWEKNKTFATDLNSKKPKKYILGMFPYPSGDGLHVGHPLSFTANDITAKYYRMNGYEVFVPMGWDAFGLPAENFAIKTGVHPSISTAKNIENFRRQIKSLGLGYDWDREVNTSSPEYYKFTQWIFKQFFDNQLAYKKNAPVNWCDSCKTVLANEQVEDGRCERCKNTVVQKNLAQWFFKITNFAEELINELDDLDWPESLKTIQRNWIGRSVGAQVTFGVTNSTELFEVFTTRPDTLFGVTYTVLAPEHELIEKLVDKIENINEVRSYQTATQKKSDLERTDLNKDKSGVKLKGIKAINPVTKEEIPIFISDYVLKSYGTGSIMAVPAHDQRDYEFAKKFDLPIKQVIEGGSIVLNAWEGDGTMIESGFLNGMEVEESKRKMIDYLETHGLGYGKVNYRLRDWLISRQRYWGAPIPIVYDDLGHPHSLPESELPVVLPTDVDFRPTGESPLVNSESFNSDEDLHRIEDLLKKDGKLDSERKIIRREADTMDTFVCSSWYFFRYLDPKNNKIFADKKILDKWLPVDVYVGGVEHAVLHLLYARFFTKALQRLGFVNISEPFVKLRNQGLIIGEDGEKMSKSRGNVINPDEVVGEYGADSFRMYEMFMGPFADSKPWSTKGLLGVRRFLDKVYANSQKVTEAPITSELETLYNQTLKKVGEDILDMSFNTAVSAMMILNNKIEDGVIDKKYWNGFIQMLSPFAPHIAEELWVNNGNTGSVFDSTWPKFDPEKLISSIIEIPVQINSKIRGKVMAVPGLSQEEVEKLAMQEENVLKYLGEFKVKKVVFIQDKIINFIV